AGRIGTGRGRSRPLGSRPSRGHARLERPRPHVGGRCVMRIRIATGSAIVLLVLSTMIVLGRSVSPVGPPQFQSLAAAGSDAVCAIRTDQTLDGWGRHAGAVVDPPPR